MLKDEFVTELVQEIVQAIAEGSQRIIVGVKSTANQHLPVGQQVRVMDLADSCHVVRGGRERVARGIKDLR